MGATELKGPVTYRYKDLKSATKNFSNDNKLGEGGFGDVYKVIVMQFFNILFKYMLKKVMIMSESMFSAGKIDYSHSSSY